MADVKSSDLRQRKPLPTASLSQAPITSSGRPEIRKNPSFRFRSNIVFYVFLGSHVVAALFHPIQDCDEVFNYFEPTHYLTHGHGFQTWEYAPTYAIRSWAYAALHAFVPASVARFTFGIGVKPIEFYLLRIVLGLVCASCENRLFNKIFATFNPRVAVFFLIIMASSPGMFHASVAYLPSSFTMYTTMLGMSAFMDWSSGLHTAQGIFAIGAGAVWGWPFAAIIALPFLLEEVALAVLGDSRTRSKFVARVVDGTGGVLLAMAVQALVDATFYKKSVIVPFNIVWYNVFSRNGGPVLYGTEPWHFYFRNLMLNFHVWFVLALFSMPLLLIQHHFRAEGKTKAYNLRGFVFLSPFYLWLAIFTLQPHKEERFMYPAYPALALNASMAMFIIINKLASTDPRDMISRVPMKLRYGITLFFVICALLLSILRTVGTINSYNAPLNIYTPLRTGYLVRPSDTVCLGKEWFRFPSHFLLPQQIEAKFIKSEFSGLLPGEFGGGFSDLGTLEGTSIEPSGMNDQNQEDVTKYTKVKHCSFIVDLHLPSTRVTELEPNYLADTEHWERVKCLPFLDAVSSPLLARLIWIPNLPFIPPKYRPVYGDYCLLQRRKPQGSQKTDWLPHIETLG